jgi:hypothetical protein
MEHRPHFEAGLLHAPEAGFNHRTGFVGERNIFG